MTTMDFIFLGILAVMLIAMLILKISIRRDARQAEFDHALHAVINCMHERNLPLEALHEIEQRARNLPRGPREKDRLMVANVRGYFEGALWERGALPRFDRR